MVYVSIPTTDTDVGSNIDEKLMTTIKEDLDDLDARTTTNTDSIALISGGVGGGGGGYSNMLYFDGPGTWTTPATIEENVQLAFTLSTGGGGGGGSNGNGGAGGDGTSLSF